MSNSKDQDYDPSQPHTLSLSHHSDIVLNFKDQAEKEKEKAIKKERKKKDNKASIPNFFNKFCLFRCPLFVYNFGSGVLNQFDLHDIYICL